MCKEKYKIKVEGNSKLNISIVGSFLSPNFGDELLLEVMAIKLREYFAKDVNIFVPFCFESINKVDWVKYNGGVDDIKKSDLVVFGGGGYFGENPAYKDLPSQTKWFFDRHENFTLFKILGLNTYMGRGIPKRQSIISFYRYYKISLTCKKFKVPYIIFGTGCGPIESNLNKFMFKSIISRAKNVYFRDEESALVSKKILHKKRISQTYDIVLSQLIENVPNIGSVKSVALHVGQISSNNQITAISQLIDYLKLRNIEIQLICDSHSEQQILPSKQLSKEKSIKLIQYKNNTKSFIDAVKDVDVLITTKLHAAIVAYSVGTIPISIPSHHKTIRFFKQIEMTDYCYPNYTDDISEVITALRKVLESPTESIRKMQKKRIEIKKTILNQFEDCFKNYN